MTQERVLIWDRIDANKRGTRILVAVFVVAFLPAAAYTATYLWVVVAVLIGALAGVLTAGGALAGDNWEAWAVLIAALAALIVVVIAGAQYYYAAALVLRLSGAKPAGRDEYPDLWRSVENLCIGAGLPQPSLYVIDSPAPNAFSTGLDPEHASLVVTRGLLALLDRRDLEAVLAHELSQIGNYDTRVNTVLAAGVGLLRLPFAVVVAVFRFMFRVHWLLGVGLLLYLGLPTVASVPIGIALAVMMIEEDPALAAALLAVMFVPLYALVLAPLLAEVVRAAVSRERQFLADADAALLTRSPEHLAIALTKMAAAGSRGLKAARATAHLYTVDPLGDDAPWWDRAFSTHPPVEERVALLAGMGGGIPPSVLQAAKEGGARFHSAPAPAVAAPPETPDATNGRPDPAEAASARAVGAAATTFRLTGANTPLYGTPDAASAPLGQLVSGSLITVLEENGQFLRVVTSDDRFGYVLRTVPMTEVDRT